MSFSKLKEEKSLNAFKEFIIVLKKLFECYVIIDFDASSKDEEKIREDRDILENYERIGQIKNNLREIVNKAVLSKNNYLWQALKIPYRVTTDKSCCFSSCFNCGNFFRNMDKK